MLLLLCFFITLLIFFGHYFLMSPFFPGVVSRTLSAALLTCAQIILSELFLGLIGLLYLSAVIAANLFLVVLVLLLARREGGAPRFLQKDVREVKTALRSAFDGPELVLGALVLLTYGWILAAAYYLPPRGIDDICYHLPAVFEYVRSHEIRLLPLFTPQFAYPENAELLFLWPVLFTHSQRLVDAINVPFVLLSVLAVYALIRQFSLPKQDSLFAALLYALCPVVLMQAGVNYIEVILSGFLLLSIYFTIGYYHRGRWVDLCLAAVATGIMAGMKYTAPFLALPLLVLTWPAIAKRKWSHALGYASIIAVTAGWWYLRNALVLGEPLYPMHVNARVPDGLVNLKGGSVLQNIRYNLPYWMTRYPLQDSKVGTYDGGFGLVFWGMCFTSWCLVALRAVLTPKRTGLPKLVLLSYLPAGFLLLLSLPPRYVDYDGRLALFAVAVGLIAFSEVLVQIQDRVYKTTIKGVCIVLSIVTVSLLSVSVQPLYRFTEAARDARAKATFSEFKYLAASSDPHIGIHPAWQLLDLLTRDSPRGMNCLIASDPALYWSSPVYGSRLQNSVLNMEREPRAIDAVVGTFSDKSRPDLALTVPGLFPGPGWSRNPSLLGLLAREDYVNIVSADNSCLLLRRDVFDLPGSRRTLLAFYRDMSPAAIGVARRLDAQLDADIPVLASGDMGYGLMYVGIEKGRPERILLLIDGAESALAAEKKMKACYTLHRPLPGYRSRKISQLMYKGQELDVFLNRRI